MSAHVYVVVGSVGEYSDRREWFVAAYTDEAMAKRHVILADARARELESELSASLNVGVGSWLFWQESGKNQYDTAMQTDYHDAARYYTAPIPLLDAVPEVA